MTKQASESPATSSTTSLNAEEILKHMSSEEIQRLQEMAAQRKAEAEKEEEDPDVELVQPQGQPETS